MPDGLGRQANELAPAPPPTQSPPQPVDLGGTGWAEDATLLEALRAALPAPLPVSGRARSVSERALHRRRLRAPDPCCEQAWYRLDGRHRTRSTDDDHRTLAFVAPPLGVEIELLRTRIVGQVIPPGEAEITLETEDGTTICVQADDLGFFVVPSRPAGAVRLICERPTARLVTDWVTD
jgi:hypothetical protein